MKKLLLLTLILTIQTSIARNDSVEVSKKQQAVLVTGASSGIGRNIAETLAAKGYLVYAGARKAKDLKALSAIKNIQGIKLDVTIQSEIIGYSNSSTRRQLFSHTARTRNAIHPSYC